MYLPLNPLSQSVVAVAVAVFFRSTKMCVRVWRADIAKAKFENIFEQVCWTPLCTIEFIRSMKIVEFESNRHVETLVELKKTHNKFILCMAMKKRETTQTRLLQLFRERALLHNWQIYFEDEEKKQAKQTKYSLENIVPLYCLLVLILYTAELLLLLLCLFFSLSLFNFGM